MADAQRPTSLKQKLGSLPVLGGLLHWLHAFVALGSHRRTLLQRLNDTEARLHDMNAQAQQAASFQQQIRDHLMQHIDLAQRVREELERRHADLHGAFVKQQELGERRYLDQRALEKDVAVLKEDIAALKALFAEQSKAQAAAASGLDEKFSEALLQVDAGMDMVEQRVKGLTQAFRNRGIEVRDGEAT